ncbi:MAG: hypothetical protein RLN81_11570 [Balneolaceae bacterium]
MRFLVILIFLLPAVSVYAQQEENQNPLEGFSTLIDGEWYSGNMVQTYEWGVGKKSVISRGYNLADTERILTETTWVWHPERKKIVGFGITRSSDIEFIEYEANFKNDTLKSVVWTYPEGIKEVSPTFELLVLQDVDKFTLKSFKEPDENSVPISSITHIKK